MPRYINLLLILFALALPLYASAESQRSANAVCQATALELTAPDTQHLLHDKFSIVAAVTALPQGVCDSLSDESGRMHLADPGQPYNSTDAGTPVLSSKRLIFAAVDASYCLLFFEAGGRGAPIPFLSLYRITGDSATLLWQAEPYCSCRATLPQIRTVILKGWYTTLNEEGQANTPYQLSPSRMLQHDTIAPMDSGSRNHLLKDYFTIVTTTNAIPISVRRTLLGQEKYKGMADKNASYNFGVGFVPDLPLRQLVFAAYNANYCLVAYIQGGAIGSNISKVSLYHLDRGRAALVWIDRPALSSADFEKETFIQLRQAIRQGSYASTREVP